MDRNSRPILRPIDFQPVLYQGQPVWYLRDPLQLSERQLFLPQAMAPFLALVDGSRTRTEIHDAFCQQVGQSLDPKITEVAIERLDEALLLDNENTMRARQALLIEYRSRPFRVPALAGTSYPADPKALSRLLQSYEVSDPELGWSGRGIISPHIDYDRGGSVYAKVWRRANDAILAAELVLILGTDHYGGLGTITLTSQSYATPFGVLPSDLPLIDKLAEALGPEAAFADELNHRQEHSVELSAVWLHHIFKQNGKQPCPVVPVLVGSFQHFLTNGEHPQDDRQISSFIEALQKETAGKRTLVVASVDLAHVGPSFGDYFIMDQTRRDRLADQDRDLISAALNGDADSWYSQIASVGDQNRICGFAPTYLTLRYLGQTSGTQIAYDQCSADHQDTSLVSICGLLLD